jgi:cation diffusion facilitator family transporter
LKFGAWFLTGSVALLSDALESIVNVVAAVGAVIAIRVSAKPPDSRHPFGHTKIEYLSAGAEGALILAAAATIVFEAWGRLRAPTELNELAGGLGVALVASAMNGALAAHLIRSGRRTRSPALLADGLHVKSDVVTSVGVLVGMCLAWATGFWILDPLLALVVAVNIVRIGVDTVGHSFHGLMDEGLSAQQVTRVREIIAANMGPALEVHDLRSRRAGPRTFLEFHLIVPGRLTVRRSHDLCDAIERALHAELPGLHVAIHVEPEGEALRDPQDELSAL